VTKTDLSPPTAASPDDVDVEAERFFAEGEGLASDGDSLSPAATDEPEEWEVERRPSLTPAQLARRARLRRIVSIGLSTGVAVLVSSIGGARLLRATRARVNAATPTHAVTGPSARSGPHTDTVSHGRTPLVRPPSAPAPSDDAGETPTAEPSSASEPSAPAGGEPSNTAAALRLATQARGLLRAGRAREGIESARAAVDADPTLAEAYVLVAAGLEDIGRWSEAHRTYVTCVDHTQSRECSYFAGRPR
jgi:hypothetical protein